MIHVDVLERAFPPRQIALPHDALLVVRAVTPTDAAALAALYDGLDVDDRYRRFFCVFRPAEAFFTNMANAVDLGGFGVVAVVKPGIADGESIVGEASYSPLPDGDGELAVTVARRWRGWLGPYLLDALLEAAAARGLGNLEAEVLVSNAPMLALLRARGYVTMDHPDLTVVRVVIGTKGRTPVWSDPHDRPRVLVEVPGARWHAEAEARKMGLRVLACAGAGRRPACPALAGHPCPLAAGADVIIISHPTDSDGWPRLAEAHHRLHPGVPVYVEHARPEAAIAGTAVPPGDADTIATVFDDIARRRMNETHAA